MEFFSYDFLRTALVMGVLSGATCGILGVLIVLWRIGFMGMCISHAAFAGALLALWGGFSPFAGSLAASLGAASLVGPLADRPNFTPDSAVSIIFSVMMGVAMLALGMLPASKTDGLSFLWGNLLTADSVDIALMACCGGLLLLFVFFFYKEIQATVSQRQAAEASGVPTKAIYYASLGLMGFLVAVAMKSVGGLLIYSLMVTPAVTALQFSRSLRQMFWLSTASGAVSAVAGLWFSYWLGIPTGVAVILVATAILAAACAVSPKRSG